MPAWVAEAVEVPQRGALGAPGCVWARGRCETNDVQLARTERMYERIYRDIDRSFDTQSFVHWV